MDDIFCDGPRAPRVAAGVVRAFFFEAQVDRILHLEALMDQNLHLGALMDQSIQIRGAYGSVDTNSGRLWISRYKFGALMDQTLQTLHYEALVDQSTSRGARGSIDFSRLTEPKKIRQPLRLFLNLTPVHHLKTWLPLFCN